MKILSFALACAAFALVPPLSASDASISAEEAAAIDEAVRLGEGLYRHDQAAWHATDAMLKEMPDSGAKGVRGWIVNELAGDTLEVVFYRPMGQGFEAVWSALHDGREVRGERAYEAGERALTEEEMALIEARNAPFSVETDYTQCSERLNFVVLPTGRPDGGLYVYILAPQPSMNVIPLGGHFRFEVVEGEVVAHRRFTNSCLDIPIESEDGSRPEATMVIHLLDDTPTEIHVFSMYVARMPVFVSTIGNGKVWSVELIDGKPSIRPSVSE